MTSLATALAACWPSTPLTVPVMVEADASGGDVAAWHSIDPDQNPDAGLVSLAAASRAPLQTTMTPQDRTQGDAGETPSAFTPLLRHATELPGGLRVVVAPADPLEAGRAVDVIAQTPTLLSSGRVTIVDVGRAVPGSAGAALLRHADVAVVLTDLNDVGQAQRLRACAPVLASLRQDGVRIGIAVTGSCPHNDAEVSQVAAQIPVWSRVPWDESGAALVRGQHRPAARMRDRLAAWWARRGDPESLEWMPLIKAAKALSELCDDFSGVGVGTSVARPARRPQEVEAA
ncbi:hypothetical protein [Nocardiopsis kunsanensis]|uniref:hypothetical protein n=1 Tax=Nocardiopsis kunsanensis TaxID=141693 RepID=UPI001892AF48|nr:hypothetical protein [Nocardiopsis kunsanensis]